MPSLILSSRYTTDSQVLRETARNLDWETLRLDGQQIPDWFDAPDDEFAMFYTAPHAFDVAAQLGRKLVGCPPDWTPSLPQRFLSRTIYQTTLAEALNITRPQFVKHSVSKAFPAAVYNKISLTQATLNLLPNSLVHVAEPVAFEVEYRCFVYDRKIATISPYLRHGSANIAHSALDRFAEERNAATSFANSVLSCEEVDCPPAFVLDVGLIKGRGWSVVEINECWASGIYGCNPEQVLQTLLRGTMRVDLVRREWDFQEHYRFACP